jgi:uncharacterized protein HemY
MKALQPTDVRHLRAAEGWIGLGDCAAANDELERISGASRAHPDVLQLRWRICVHADKWDDCLDIATVLTTATPKRLFGWIHRAHTLDKLGRTQEAKDLLVSVADKFESSSTIPFHLARYCCGLGQLDEAKHWLGKALLAADGVQELARLRNLAIEDPALAPLRSEH